MLTSTTVSSAPNKPFVGRTKTRNTKFALKLNTQAQILNNWAINGIYIGTWSRGSNAHRPAWTHAHPMNNEYSFFECVFCSISMPDLPAEGITNHAAMPTPFLIFIPRPSFLFSPFARYIFDVIEDSTTVKLRYGSSKLSRWQNCTSVA